MSDTNPTRGDDSADERAMADGGTEVTGGPLWIRDVVDRTGEAQASDATRLGNGGDEHLFGPAELPRWALSLPLVGALAVAVGAQGSTVLAAGGASAWAGTVVAAVGLLAVVALTLRAV